MDVREQWEYDTARLPLFKLFPLSSASSWAATIEDDLDPDTETVVLCHHGVRSMQMAAVSGGVGWSKLKGFVALSWCCFLIVHQPGRCVGGSGLLLLAVTAALHSQVTHQTRAVCAQLAAFPSANVNLTCPVFLCPVCLLPPFAPIQQFLVSKGFKTVKNVTGGIAAYSMIDRSVPEY